MTKAKAAQKKVVVIEDDADVALALTTILRGLNAEVITAGDGVAGVEAVRREKPDLVLVDIHLPRMNGLEVLRTIRFTPELASMPVIVITGNSTVEYVKETARLRADDFLVKANVLGGAGLDRIRKLLSRKKASPRKRVRARK